MGLTWLRAKLREFRQAHAEADKLRSENVRAIESGQCSPAQLDDITVKLDAAKKGDSKTLKGTQRLVLPMTLLFLALNGCVTDRDAVLVDQTEKAGEYIESHSAQPDVRQAGTDVKLNAQTIKKNVTGDAPAELKKPYTPQNSAEARQGSDQSHSGGLWKWVSAGLGILLPVVFAVARAHPWGAVVANIVEPYANKLLAIHTQAEDHPGDVIHRDDIEGHLEDLLADPKAGPVVAKLLTKIGLEQQPPAPPAAPTA